MIQVHMYIILEEAAADLPALPAASDLGEAAQIVVAAVGIYYDVECS